MDELTPDDELLRLIRFFIRSKDGFAIAFARGLSPAERKPILEQVSSALAEEETSLRVADYSGRRIQDLYQQLDADGFLGEPHLPTIVLGLESSIFGDDGDRFLRVLNLDRDRFRKNYTAPLLFWLSPAAANKLQADAHDFYDYWTGLFDFAEGGVDMPVAPQERHLKAISFQLFIAPAEDERRFLEEEIARHREIINNLSSIEEIVDERSRLRAIESLRILARNKGRLGRIDEAKAYIAQSLELMPPLMESASPGPAAVQAWGDCGSWLSDQFTHHNAALAIALIDDHQMALKAAAKAALNLGMYAAAQALLKPLNEFWNVRGLCNEANDWADEVLLRLESLNGAPPDPTSEAGELWVFMASAHANHRLTAGQLDEAEKRYLAIQTVLEASDLRAVKGALAIIYHQLGIIAYSRGALDRAEALYNKSIEMKEALGNRPDLASSYHQLGMVLQDRGALDQAEDWFKKSLEINEEIGNARGLALTYHQLGRVAEERGALDQATSWYKRSLKIEESIGSRSGLALTYGQLGLLAEKRGSMQASLDWTVRCVKLLSDLSDPSTDRGFAQLSRLTRTLGMEALEAAWLRCNGVLLPETVRRGISKMLNNGENGRRR